MKLFIIVHCNGDNPKESTLEGVFGTFQEAEDYVFQNGGRYFKANGRCIFQNVKKKEALESFRENFFIEWGPNSDHLVLYETDY
jgi:hypothetical protein